jgi:hypothetical protein
MRVSEDQDINGEVLYITRSQVVKKSRKELH